MRFSLRHLLYVIAVFAASLASGFPSSLFLPDGAWEVVSIHEEDGNGGGWHSTHPAMHDQLTTTPKDYIATIRNGRRTETINLGDTVFVSQHRLQLPDVGSYVVIGDSSADPHGKLPVRSAGAPSRVRFLIAAFFSLLCSVAFVSVCVSVRSMVQRQANLNRERRMIDRTLRSQS